MKHPASMHIGFKFILLSAAALLASCDRGGDGLPQVNPDFVEVEDPNRFLQFLNPQVGLPAGSYRIVAGTQTLGDSGNFTITVTRDDGAVQTFAGSWPSSGSGGTDALSAANPSFDYSMPYSGGATIGITSAAETCLFLLDSGGSVIAGKNGADECANPDTIDLPASKINQAANARAYYRAIDPDNTRTTLEGWMDANNFGQPCDAVFGDDPCEVHVIFRDTKDLGYGRDMYARLNRNPDNSIRSFAVFVRNFRVDAISGQQYSTMNLNAAIANNTDPTRQSNIQWHFGSNAIEFSTYPYGPGEPGEDYAADNLPGGVYATNDGTAPMFAKFFTFKPDDVNDPNTTERRLDVVNLDSRGDKSMPGPCIACHGGTSRALLPSGEFPAPIPGSIPGDTQSQMQVIEASTVTFSEVPGWTCGDIVSGIHFINQGVLNTYAQVRRQYGDPDPNNQRLGYWQPEFAAELIKGWYGDFASAADPDDFTIEPAPGDPDYNAAAQCDYLINNFYDYVPSGWQPNPNTGTPPAGADDLFREVVAPNCMVCHSRRGVNLGPNDQEGVRQDIDFSSYERFMRHAEQIEHFIFHKGVMPLGLLNFDAFWDNSEPGRAELLASHLPDFESFNADGSIQKPGAPYAVIAAPRNTNVPVILSAEGSSFADSYQWSIVNPVTGATLTGADAARPVFDAPAGDYTVQLIVSRDGQQSEPVTADITVDPALPAPSSLRFVPDIRDVLQNPPTDCDSCHSPEAFGGVPGVPVFYVERDDLPAEYQNEGRDLYLEVLQRINFKEPIESPLLRKPSNHHHFGGLRSGFNLEGDRTNYDLFLNWILQGAPR